MIKSTALASLVATGALALMGMGCNQAAKGSDRSASAQSGSAGANVTTGSGELLVWVMPNSPKPEKDMETLLEPFQAAHPGIKVKVSVLDWGSAWTKLTTAAISGDGPDVVQLGTTWCPFLTDLGALLPLDDLDSAVHMQDAFLPNTWAAAKPRTSSHVTSAPWFIDVRPMFYRTDVFAQAGVDPKSAATWDGYMAALEKIKKAGIKHNGEAVSPIGFPGKNDWNVVHNFAPWIWSAGGDFLSPLGDKCVLNSPESMRGILFYLNMVHKGLNPKTNMEKNTAQVSADFDAGRVASFFESTIKNVYLERPPEQGGSAGSHVSGNYGVLIPPAGPVKRSLFMGGSHLAVFKSSKRPDLAKMLVRYLTADSAAQLAYAEISGFLPALKSAFASPYFSADAKRTVFRDIVAYGRCYPAVPYWGEIETAILMKRLGNLFDIAAEVNGPYSEALVKTEMDAAVKDIDGQIQAHFKNHPEQMDLLKKSMAAAQ
ncbi:MAG: extracellular solute-binding protein [Fibrobacteria bacterium]